MARQIDMQESLLKAHREFIDNLEKSIEVLEKDVAEASEMTHICTDEWCKSTDLYIDELNNMIYSISEPRFASKEDSEKIRELRKRIKNLYAQYKAMH